MMLTSFDEFWRKGVTMSDDAEEYAEETGIILSQGPGLIEEREQRLATIKSEQDHDLRYWFTWLCVMRRHYETMLGMRFMRTDARNAIAAQVGSTKKCIAAISEEMERRRKEKGA